MAAGLVLVVAVSVLPLFMRALESNTSGGRSSQLSTLLTAEFEQVNQALIDRDDWQLTDISTDVRNLDPRFWDTGQLYTSVGSRDELGDEEWIGETDIPEGPLLWMNDTAVRKYSFADIHIGLEVAGDTLDARGDPRLFDSPLSTGTDGVIYNSHFTELRVSIVENREAIPVGNGQRITVGHFRAY